MPVTLEPVRRLWRLGLKPAAVGREQWRRQVATSQRATAPAVDSPPSHRRPEPLLTTASYQAIAARNRAQATPAELEWASAEGPVTPVCERCGGGRFVLERVPGERVGRPVPCDCLPLSARAALAGIDARYRTATLERFQALEGKRVAHEWCLAWDGRTSVVLVGSQFGTGKTHLGVGLLLRALESGRPARFVHVPSFLEEVKARFDGAAGEQSQAYADRIANEPLLMLDDLGQERVTDWTRGILRWLFDVRWRRELTTIVTTNRETEAELADYVGGAVASRLRAAKSLRVAGKDMRALLVEEARVG